MLCCILSFPSFVLLFSRLCIHLSIGVCSHFHSLPFIFSLNDPYPQSCSHHVKMFVFLFGCHFCSILCCEIMIGCFVIPVLFLRLWFPVHAPRLFQSLSPRSFIVCFALFLFSNSWPFVFICPSASLWPESQCVCICSMHMGSFVPSTYGNAPLQKCNRSV